MSNETKFTKGDWAFNPHDGTITDNTKAANAIAEVYTDDWHNLGEGLANAHLMKTSSKMYALLEELKVVSSGAYPEIIEKTLAEARGEK